MGLALDLYGVRRTLLLSSPLTVAGAAVSALAPNFSVLVLGQVLIGMGCAPAFLVCAVFIARHFPAHRYATVSSIILAVGSLGAWAVGRITVKRVEKESSLCLILRTIAELSPEKQVRSGTFLHTLQLTGFYGPSS